MRSAEEERERWDAAAAADPMAAAWAADDLVGSVTAALERIESGLDYVSGEFLDLGCGPGRLAVPFARRYPAARRVTGLDVSPTMILAARRNGAGVSNLRFVEGDGRRIPLRPPLDGGWSVLLFQHLELPVVLAYLAQVGRLLRPGATFVFQHVEGRDEVDGPYSHRHASSTLFRFLDSIGLYVRSVETDERFPEWRWTTVVAS